MKTLKKIASIMFALLMIATTAVGVFADEDPVPAAGSNTITVNGAKAGETYSLYKMLDLDVGENFTAYHYTIKTDSAWYAFFTTGKGATYVTIATDGVVTWEAGKNTDADKAAFGVAAAKYAADNNSITATTVSAATADGKTTASFTSLEAGYYLITSSLGTKVIVATTPDAPNTEINEKNTEPTIDKLVKEDSNNKYGEENTAQIGDTVEFKTTVHAKVGAKNYVIHDKMDEAFTFNANSIKLEVKVGDNTTTLVKDTDYTVTTPTDGYTFEIAFTETYLNSLTADTDIVVLYSAVLNDNAKIYTNTNDNTTWLTYGANGETTESKTETSTFMFDLVKTKADDTLLNGAEFKLYTALTGGEEIKLVKETDGSYRIATAAEIAAEGFTSAIIEAGKVTIKGLDANTKYYLEEITAPVGYNKLSERVLVDMKETNLTAVFEQTDTNKYTSGGVQVINQTGNELPSTGGIGTTLFYVIGSVLVVGAVVLFVTKKRMSRYE